MNQYEDGTSPSDIEINNLLQQYQNRQYDGAEKLALYLTERFPDHQFAWKVLGAIRKQTGRVLESLVPTQKAVSLAPGDAAAHSNLGNVFKELGRFEEAEVSYVQAITLQPGYADAHNNLGILLQELGRFDEAEASYVKAIALQPSYAEPHNKLGITLQELGRLEEAKAAFMRAVALKPDFVEAENNLGNTLKDLGKLDQAEESYRRAIALNPNYAEAHFNLGNTLKELFRLDEAELSYRQSIALKPDYAEAHSNLANTLREFGRISEAESSYSRAISSRPDYPLAHHNLSAMLEELGRFDEAEASARQAIALKPNYAEAHYNLGITLKELGRLEEAEASFKQVIVLKPDHIDAHSNLLRSFFLLDKQHLFSDELDYLIKQGEASALIGSLTYRSALKYGLEKENLFCRDPLKYVLHIDLNAQYCFEDIFVKKVKTILSKGKVTNRDQYLLTNGYHTSGNLFDIEDDLTGEIQEIIRLEVEKYRLNFQSSEEGLIRKWPTEYSIYSWLIRMKRGGELQPHIHSQGWLSGSLYINVPPKSKINSGNLVVSLGEEKDVTGSCGNDKNTIDVVTGSLVLFPASLTHYTIPFESEEERIVLAFDVVPK